MKPIKTAGQAVGHHIPSLERRHADRVATSFGLMYSAVDADDVLIGDGTVTDLSCGGLGIRGNCPVKAGMELTLFLYLPDGDDPLFIVEAYVAWTSGRQFGVRFNQLSLREGKRLHTFLLR